MEMGNVVYTNGRFA